MSSPKTSPPWVAAPLAGPRRRPQLRCPACAAHFTLPAEICPHCRIDLRLGCRRKKRLLPRWLRIPPRLLRPLGRVVTLGLMLALAGAAVKGIYGYVHRPPAPMAAVPRAPDAFQRLAGEYPILLRPYVIMYKTRAAVADYRDNLTYRQHFMEELAKSAAVDVDQGDREALVMSRQLTPGQRLRMLKELMAMSAPPGQVPISDQELMREMSPPEITRELEKLNKDTAGR